MAKRTLILALSCLSCLASSRDTVEPVAPAAPGTPVCGPLDALTRPQRYVLTRESSYDRSGGNADFRRVSPGDSLTLLDRDGPGVVSHVWMTIASADDDHLENLILRMYWDGEESPSVEAPVGAFFGLGLGEYVSYSSTLLSVAPDKALNAFFPMPFREHAKITLENTGREPVRALYWNIDVRNEPVPADALYFNAQYRSATPERGDDYVFLETTGRGHFVGVTMALIENSDGWWGEGDDRFYVDGERAPSIHGTGSEDYFLGAWDFGGKSFAYPTFGAPVVGREAKGEKWSLYRFHLDAPITFQRSLRASIEHGHANDRSDDVVSVAYFYQTAPHAALPRMRRARMRR
jgi:hypothetical protein